MNDSRMRGDFHLITRYRIAIYDPDPASQHPHEVSQIVELGLGRLATTSQAPVGHGHEIVAESRPRPTSHAACRPLSPVILIDGDPVLGHNARGHKLKAVEL